MRAGRFDRSIYVDLPELHERKEIFDVHLAKIKLAADIDREFLAKQTPGSVSYTHLDVYKRQGINRQKIFGKMIGIYKIYDFILGRSTMFVVN